MKKIIWIGIIVISIVSIIYIIQTTNEKNPINPNSVEKTVNNTVKLQNSGSLFSVFGNISDAVINDENELYGFKKLSIVSIKENQQLYDSLGPKNSNQTTIVIIPHFTFLAYSDHGFYDYYTGKCNEECLTINAVYADPKLKYNYESSVMSYQVFKILGYDLISDGDVDRNPSILAKYDRVIVLHSEYVTQKEFDAITKHPKVIYLYPNALHAKITVDYENKTITLIRGHGYPDANIDNGFDWIYDNTRPYEFDKECNNWEFYDISNGKMLNCYPENIIYKDIKFLQLLLNL